MSGEQSSKEQLIEERRQVEERLRALHELARQLGETVDLARTIRACADAAMQHTALDSVGVYLMEESTGEMHLAYSRGLSAPFVEMIAHLRADTPEIRLVCEGRSVYTNFPQLPVPMDEGRRHEGLRAIAVIPIQHQARTIASFNVASHTLDNVASADRVMLETLATMVGSFVVRAQKEEQRKLAEAALQASEEKYRMLAEIVTDVIWTMDMDLRLTFASPSVLRLRGFTPEEAAGQSLSELVGPKSLGEIELLLARQQQLIETSDESTWDPVVFEVELLCKDGTTVHTSNTTKFVQGPTGRPISIVGATHDLTPRRQAEQQQKTEREQLQQAQKLEAIGRLAGGVAHDFNNMLCAIMGYAELALCDLTPEDPLRSCLEEINKASTRAADLTRQLLTFSRRQVIAPKVINVRELIESLHSMLERLIGEHIIFRTVPKALGRIRADPGQIEQVVVNLVINARDAMPDGGELLVETTDLSLNDDPHAAPGECVMLAVSDTGCGMSPEIREQIFEPFFTTKELGQGTGLGLATVYDIVEQNGGRIEVDSEPGKGSCFKVYFPRVLDEPEPLVRASAPAPAGGHETLLVVEDEQMVRALAVTLLRRRGYQVLPAGTAGDAIELAARHEGPIDLLLTDVVMPHMNGRELAERLAQLRPRIKVLYTSGYIDSVIAHQGVLEEGLQFVAKPYSITTLATRVREVLDLESQ